LCGEGGRPVAHERQERIHRCDRQHRHEAVRVLKEARRFLRWATPLPSRVELVVFAGRWFK
jgi:hypothetical protein